MFAFAVALARRKGLSLSENGCSGVSPVFFFGEGSPRRSWGAPELEFGAVTALIDRLERAGQVERRPNPGDRRSLVARPRPSGLEGARCHLLLVGAELLEASRKLSDEERAAVGAYLETITEVFARHARA